MVISKLERAYYKNFDDAFLCVLDLSGKHPLSENEKLWDADY